MWGEFAAIATAVCWSFTAIFFSYSGRRIGANAVNHSRLIFAMIFLATTHYILEGSLFPYYAEPFRWGWLGVSGLLGLVIGDAFLFHAYVLIGPRLSMLMMSTVPIFSLVFGWALFGETIGPIEFVGIILAIGAMAWVVTERPAGFTVVENKQYWRGLLFGLGGALGQVANLVTAKYGLVDDFSTVSATIMRIFIAAVVLWGISIIRGQAGAIFRTWRDGRAFAALVAGAVVGPFLGIWFSMAAVQWGRLGIVSTLMALPPVLLIPLEYAINRRPVSRRGIIGTLVAFAGIVLIFAGSG
jgi:drug/metabolite transporter (DMT)-like permease